MVIFIVILLIGYYYVLRKALYDGNRKSKIQHAGIEWKRGIHNNHGGCSFQLVAEKFSYGRCRLGFLAVQ